jgi:hypothetical protein
MAYYVSHMRSAGRARVHNGSCVHCRNVQVQEKPAKSGSGATGWSRPFETLGEAEAYMRAQFPNYVDVGKCKLCEPGVT